MCSGSERWRGPAGEDLVAGVRLPPWWIHSFGDLKEQRWARAHRWAERWITLNPTAPPAGLGPSSSPPYSSLCAGRAHIRRAIQGHEEALRIYSLCKHINKLDVLQEILKASHQRSLDKSSEHESEEEFADYMEAPEIICKIFLLFFLNNTNHK